jgi:NADH dehydrogenase
MKPARRILILGGGFAGVYAALRLQKKLRRSDDVEVTLVNRENFFLFTPMLHEIAAGDLDPADIVSPIRALLKRDRRVNLVCADVQCVDLERKRVTVAHGYEHHTHELEYDYLILALGSVTNFFKLPGVEERALTMKSLGDAIELRNRLVAHLEEADAEAEIDQQEARALMTFVVAGGGFAGIETIAGVNDFVRESLKFYPHLSEDMVRVVVVHPGDTILPELGPDLGAYAQRKLAKRGVEILTNTKVAQATDDGVHLSDRQFIPTRTLIWTAGTAPHPLVGMLPCPCDRGRIAVDQFLQVQKWPGVFALGDCASVPDRRTGKPHPPTAQHAVREARIAADNVLADIREQPERPFDFKLIGQLAAIGHRTGVAKIFGVKFSGFLAWWLWRTIYLAKLPRFEKKLRVAIDWTLDLLFAKDLVQYFSSVRASAVSHDLHHDEDHGHIPASESVEARHRAAATVMQAAGEALAAS